MEISKYHLQQQALTDEEIQQRMQTREYELTQVFSQAQLSSPNSPLRIAVLGCGDKRMIPAYKRIFEKLLLKPIMMSTFDISTEHLKGESEVYEFDVTQPIPNAPYDLTYSYQLLRFIDPSRQWAAIENAFSAVSEGGMSIHILDNKDFMTQEADMPEGFHSVPLDTWKRNLYMQGVQFVEVPLMINPRSGEDALALVLIK